MTTRLMRIWKYPLSLTDKQKIAMPVNAIILSAQLQGGSVTLWAMVDDGERYFNRTIEIFGTGNPMNKGARSFIGTVQQGELVWHVFELL